MKISELARRTGTSVPTLTYYLRERLLEPGRATARNQADYDERHVDRVRLIRVLREAGDVPIRDIRRLVEAMREQPASPHEAMVAAARAIAPASPAPGPLREEGRRIADALIDGAGWARVAPDAPDREHLAAVLEVILSLGTHGGDPSSVLSSYAEAADRIARFEIADLDGDQPAEALVAQMVVGQVVFGQLLQTLRRLAEEHHSAERFDPTGR